ncbi:MAG: DUF2851 family protein, partial [Bacteroidales bacterium]|nr:DUF2851 family protein [Bacteroidales bacterium]
LELLHWIPEGITERYGHWLSAKDPMPCRDYLHQINPSGLMPWLGRLALERMERKGKEFISSLDGSTEQWDLAFYISLFRAFGLPANALPFELLGRMWTLARLPAESRSEDIEAILLYLSGLLPGKVVDPWTQSTLKLGSSLAGNLTPLEPSLWSMLRMRPAAFPSVRLAQLSRVLSSLHPHDHAARLSLSTSQWMEVLSQQASEYWDGHYLPGQSTLRSYPKVIGPQLKTTIAANAIAPYLCASGLWSDNHDLVRRAVTLLEQMAPEDNHITRHWEALDQSGFSGLESQGWMEVHSSLCSQARCLECRIGYLLIGGS